MCCGKLQDKGWERVTIFSFGKSGSFRREKWLGALRISLNQEIPSSWRICAVSTLEYAVSWSNGHEWLYHNLTFQNHFAPDAWENERVNGTRQLKRNAIPTQLLSSYDAENCPPPICGSNPSEHSYSSNKRAVRTPFWKSIPPNENPPTAECFF